MDKEATAADVLDRQRWGLPKEAVADLAGRLRCILGIAEAGQHLQQFRSDSPWSGQMVFEQIQAEIQQCPELAGGMLTLDESGDECAGKQKAGAARQYLGRLGKVALGQVAVAAGY